MMNRQIKRGMILLSLTLLSLLFAIPSQAAQLMKDKVSAEKKAKKEAERFPIGCRPVGYQKRLKVLSLFPGKEGALQSMYFFYNKLPETVSLYQMRGEESEYTTRFNHIIKANSWAVLASGEPLVKFICTLGDGKSSYGKIVDCAKTVKVCEYVNVKFGLNNKGNLWIVDSNSRNGAVSEVVHYGIIPGV